MNINELSHDIWLRVGAPDEVEESAITEIIQPYLAASSARVEKMEAALKQIESNEWQNMSDASRDVINAALKREKP